MTTKIFKRAFIVFTKMYNNIYKIYCIYIKSFNLHFINYLEDEHLQLFSFPLLQLVSKFIINYTYCYLTKRGHQDPFGLTLDPPPTIVEKFDIAGLNFSTSQIAIKWARKSALADLKFDSFTIEFRVQHYNRV